MNPSNGSSVDERVSDDRRMTSVVEGVPVTAREDSECAGLDICMELLDECDSQYGWYYKDRYTTASVPVDVKQTNYDQRPETAAVSSCYDMVRNPGTMMDAELELASVAWDGAQMVGSNSSDWILLANGDLKA